VNFGNRTISLSSQDSWLINKEAYWIHSVAQCNFTHVGYDILPVLQGMEWAAQKNYATASIRSGRQASAGVPPLGGEARADHAFA
jgi:hypothetical protein